MPNQKTKRKLYENILSYFTLITLPYVLSLSELPIFTTHIIPNFLQKYNSGKYIRLGKFEILKLKQTFDHQFLDIYVKKLDLT
jgi:hypothetical protein